MKEYKLFCTITHKSYYVKASTEYQAMEKLSERLGTSLDTIDVWIRNGVPITRELERKLTQPKQPVRKPAERVNGKYKEKPEGFEEFVDNMVNEMCDQFSDIDILDLENMFHHQFGYRMMMRLMRENAESV